jgi:hypothetical protein
MPVNHENKIIFIHIPKTGGTSIQKFLNLTFSDEAPSKKEQIDYFKEQKIKFDYYHSTAYQYKRYVLKEYFERYFKFTFVRNPYDRCVSEFFYANKGHKKRDITPSHAPWLDLKPKKDFSPTAFSNHLVEYTKQTKRYKSHRACQSHFILDENGNSLVDFIGKYENLKEDLIKILDILKINKSIEELPHRYKNLVEYDKSQYLTPKNKELILNIFEKDFELFGYEK